jgi:hypothetical protein
MTSLAGLSTELGVPCPTDAHLRTAVAAALDAA